MVSYETRRYLLDRDGIYELFLPDDYEPDEQGMEGVPDRALTFVCERDAYTAAVAAWMDDAENALPYDDPEAVIEKLHEVLPEHQGLIEVENGETPEGRSYLYFIVKYQLDAEVPAPGNGYQLCMHIDFGEKFLFLQTFFEEAGMSGMRDTYVFAELAGERKMTSDFEGWSFDPYDWKREKGYLMNCSELEEYDDRFPEHPLSVARRMRDFFIDAY